jgi:AcrR family transcriptional regulator
MTSPPSGGRVGLGGQVDGVRLAGGTQVSNVQRARMLAAAMEVVGERGFGGMSVARVTSRAGVSRRTFYDLFEDREDCFLSVFDDAVAQLAAVARETARGAEPWLERVRAGLAGVLVLFGDEPVFGALLVVDALGAGPRVLARRAAVLASLSEFIDEGRSTSRTGREAPPLTAEGVVGAVLSVIHARMLESDPRPPIELLNSLMAMIVLPYLGHGAAARELASPAPGSDVYRSARVARDPLGSLDMRLTYRTLRVLATIASAPGRSNRQVADTAGVNDQGQISKLLGRLQSLGLISNTVRDQSKGEPNAWTLTPKGQDVARVIEAQTR